MDGHAHQRFENGMCLQRLFGAHVHGAHEPSWAVGPDGQKCQTRCREACRYFRKMGTETCISGEENASVRIFDLPSAPQRSVSIEQATRRKMLRGNAVDNNLTKGLMLPPVQLHDGMKTEPPEPRCNAQRTVDRGGVAPFEPAQRSGIQMVVVIVAEQNDVDRRQVFKTNPGCAMPARPCELHRTGAIAPDRICDDIEFADLQQDRRMVHECHAQLAYRQSFRRRGASRSADPFLPCSLLAMGQPFEHRTESRLLRCMRSEEASILAVVRVRPTHGPMNARRGYLLQMRIR